MRVAALLVAGVLALGPAAAEAAIRLYAYDPANAATREAAGGLTFEFKQKLIFNTVLSLRSTVGQAKAELAPADEKALGGGLAPLIGEGAPERDLYEVKPEDDGEALVRALCPGEARRGFLAFGRLRANRPLRVHVLAVDGAGAPRLCRTLDFQFRAEWPMPRDNPRVTARDLKQPRFPH